MARGMLISFFFFFFPFAVEEHVSLLEQQLGL